MGLEPSLITIVNDNQMHLQHHPFTFIFWKGGGYHNTGMRLLIIIPILQKNCNFVIGQFKGVDYVLQNACFVNSICLFIITSNLTSLCLIQLGRVLPLLQPRCIKDFLCFQVCATVSVLEGLSPLPSAPDKPGLVSVMVG